MKGVKVANAKHEQYANFFVFLAKIFYFNISISEGLLNEKEVSTVPTRCPEKYVTIFVFRKRNFFFNISISGDRSN